MAWYITNSTEKNVSRKCNVFLYYHVKRIASSIIIIFSAYCKVILYEILRLIFATDTGILQVFPLPVFLHDDFASREHSASSNIRRITIYLFLKCHEVLLHSSRTSKISTFSLIKKKNKKKKRELGRKLKILFTNLSIFLQDLANFMHTNDMICK